MNFLPNLSSAIRLRVAISSSFASSMWSSSHYKEKTAATSTLMESVFLEFWLSLTTRVVIPISLDLRMPYPDTEATAELIMLHEYSSDPPSAFICQISPDWESSAYFSNGRSIVGVGWLILTGLVIWNSFSDLSLFWLKVSFIDGDSYSIWKV